MKKYIIIILSFLIITESQSQQPPPPVLYVGEKYTNLYSVSYDYQSTGSVRYIVQDPTNPNFLCTILMAQRDTTSAPGIRRYIYYSYSDDNGDNWFDDVITTTTSFGFPCLTLRNGNTIISAQQSAAIGMRVWEDVVFGGFSLTELTGVQPITGTNQPAGGVITGTTNGNLVMLASANNDTSSKAFNNTYQGWFSSWSSWKYVPHINSALGNYTIASGSNGVVGIFGMNSESNIIFYYKSVDNGITFDGGIKIFKHYISGADTIYANTVGGMQAVYSSDNTPHLIFAAYGEKNYVFPNPYTKTFVSPKILHWSPATGVNVIAGRLNISNLADTITNSLVAPLCQPSIGIREDGKIVCSFTAYLTGNTQTVDNGDILNAGEIMISWSANNSSSWSNPLNATNTPNLEEKNSSTPTVLAAFGSEALKLFYQRDMKAGNWVTNPAWGKAPVYGIYKKVIIFSDSEIDTEKESFELTQNYPNPFNPSTEIQFTLSAPGFTSLVVYDALGKEITKLVNKNLTKGSYSYSFDAGKYNLPSGMYYYKLTSGNLSKVNKMMLIR